jgi:hypothetical protein
MLQSCNELENAVQTSMVPEEPTFRLPQPRSGSEPSFRADVDAIADVEFIVIV